MLSFRIGHDWPEFSTRTAIILIGAVAITLRVVFFTGDHGYDDQWYLVRAVELSRGGFELPSTVWAARVGLSSIRNRPDYSESVALCLFTAWCRSCASIG